MGTCIDDNEWLACTNHRQYGTATVDVDKILNSKLPFERTFQLQVLWLRLTHLIIVVPVLLLQTVCLLQGEYALMAFQLPAGVYGHIHTSDPVETAEHL